MSRFCYSIVSSLFIISFLLSVPSFQDDGSTYAAAQPPVTITKELVGHVCGESKFCRDKLLLVIGQRTVSPFQTLSMVFLDPAILVAERNTAHFRYHLVHLGGYPTPGDELRKNYWKCVQLYVNMTGRLDEAMESVENRSSRGLERNIDTAKHVLERVNNVTPLISRTERGRSTIPANAPYLANLFDSMLLVCHYYNGPAISRSKPMKNFRL